MNKKNIIKKVTYDSPVILTFTIISLFVWILGILTNKASTYMFFTVYKSSPFDIFYYIRLVGHIFGHVNFTHFVGNFALILLIGPIIEEKYGSRKLIGMIAITAIITGVIGVLFFKNGLLGASGIVFMLILLSSASKLKKGEIPLTFILVAAFYIGQEFLGLFKNDNISQLTHIIGGICGAVFGFFINNNE